MSDFTQDFRSQRRNYQDGTTRVNQIGRLWYDSNTNSLRISDGETPGGNGLCTRIITKRDNNDTSVAITTSTPTIITGMTHDIPNNVPQLVNFNSQFTVNTTSSETAQAKTDLVALYDRLVALTATVTDHAATHGSETLGPGVYTTAGAMNITGTLTLNGSATDLFVFRCAGAFTTGASAEVILTGGAVSSNVWIVAEGAASTGASTVFRGNIMANTAAVSTGASTSIEGRMMAISGAVGIGAASIVTAPTGTSVQALGTLDSFNLFTGTGAVSTTGTDTTVALGIGTNSGNITGFVVANVGGNIVPGGAPNIAEFHVGVYIDGVVIPDSIRTSHRSADHEGSEHPIVLQTVADISTEGQTIDIRAYSTLGTCTVGPGMIMVLTPVTTL